MSYTLVIPGELWTVNNERTRHWSWRHTRTALWRRDAFFIAKAAHIPAMIACTIDVKVEQGKGRLADVEAHSPAVKAVIDGALVDTGVLPDDTGEYVHSIRYHAPTRSPDKIDRLFITITEAVTHPSDHGH